VFKKMGERIKKGENKNIYSNSKKRDLNANNIAKGRYIEKLDGVSGEVVWIGKECKS
jgi:hypothetical protein